MHSAASILGDPWLLALALAIGSAAAWASLRIAAWVLGGKRGHWFNELRARNRKPEECVADGTHQLPRAEVCPRAIIATAHDCIISFDAVGRVIELNPAAEKQLGWSRALALGACIVDLIVPEPQRDNMRMLLHDYASGAGHIALNEPREAEMERHDGSKFPAEFSIAKTMLGNALCCTMFLRDITARRAAQAALFAAKEAAEAANAAKTALLASMSHEISTPMNALLGLQERLSLSRLDDDQRATMRLLQQSAKSLLRLLDDALDFSKIEAGKLAICGEPTLIRSLLDEVCAAFAGMAHEQGLTLTCTVAPAVPPLVIADALRVRQVLGNLLSNAIKFRRASANNQEITSRGEISMHTAFRLDERGTGVVEFRIQDHGIGMSDAVLATLGDSPGLGLAICRRLVDLMHGTLEVRSQPDIGTQVTVRLPLEPVASSGAPSEPDFTRGSVLDRGLPPPQSRAMPERAVALPTTNISTHLTPELQAEFCSAHEADMVLLEQSVEDGDVLAINAGAHRIRGAARMFGALGIDRAAARLQHAARTENWHQIKQALTLLRTETGLLFAQFDVPRSKTA